MPRGAQTSKAAVRRHRAAQNPFIRSYKGVNALAVAKNGIINRFSDALIKISIYYCLMLPKNTARGAKNRPAALRGRTVEKSA